MQLLLVTMLSLFSFCVSQEQTEEQSLSQEVFFELINGQTMQGEWAGKAYEQVFFEDGRTSYREDGGSISWGTWRIREDGWYCSIWPPSPRESCYEVGLQGDVFIWHSGANRYVSQLLMKEP